MEDQTNTLVGVLYQPLVLHSPAARSVHVKTTVLSTFDTERRQTVHIWFEVEYANKAIANLQSCRKFPTPVAFLRRELPGNLGDDWKIVSARSSDELLYLKTVLLTVESDDRDDETDRKDKDNKRINLKAWRFVRVESW